jgi:RNA polymerase sigma factor (sigma-70 family)
MQMPEVDDIELLAQYARENSEAAFAALVERHLSLVHSVALRHVGNSHAAEEITQAVFIILSKKAHSFSPNTILSGWLYQTARLTAANYLRTEIRRQNREQEAHMQSIPDESTNDTAWKQMAPHLDEAVSKLRGKDRDALVLRYFENKSLREVGDALGLRERAAQKRVNRAIEKLRTFFARRGVNLTAAIIAGVVSANSVQAAPLGLAVTITTTVTTGSTVAVSTLTLVKGTLKIMTWLKLKFAAGVVAAVLLAGGAATVVYAAIAEPAGPDQVQATELITAVQNDDYDAFMADGNALFKELPKERFDAVSAQIASRLKAGYTLTYFGDLKQLGYHLTVWKISFKAGGDDYLAEMSVKDGKVGGFWIR